MSEKRGRPLREQILSAFEVEVRKTSEQLAHSERVRQSIREQIESEGRKPPTVRRRRETR